MSNISPENMHFNVLGANPKKDQLIARAVTEGVFYNNEGNRLNDERKYSEAIAMFQRALEIKAAAYGPESLHMCISLSGLADAYLGNKQFDKATEEAQKMLTIATAINRPDQVNIAKEILKDIHTAQKAKA